MAAFEWLDFERLKDEYFYPLFLKKEIFNLPVFLKKEIFNLPESFTIRTEHE